MINIYRARKEFKSRYGISHECILYIIVTIFNYPTNDANDKRELFPSQYSSTFVKSVWKKICGAKSVRKFAIGSVLNFQCIIFGMGSNVEYWRKLFWYISEKYFQDILEFLDTYCFVIPYNFFPEFCINFNF